MTVQRSQAGSTNPAGTKEGELIVMPPVSSDRERMKDPEEAEYLEDRDNSDEASWRNLVAFWILGLCNNYGYVVMLSAAHDILSRFDPNKHSGFGSSMSLGDKRECNYMSTGAILLADIIPSLITKIVSPFFPLCVHVRMALILILSCLGYILVGAAETQWVALLGVVATAFSSGLGEATLLSYMPFFKNKNVISTWSSGTGGAGFFGSLSYACLTGLGLSPSTTLYILLIVPAFMGFSFWVLMKRPNVEASGVATPPESTSSAVNGGLIDNDRVPLTFNNDSFAEKLQSIPPLFKYMIPLGLVYFFEYLINQGLFELVYFENSFLTHAEQYRWYQVDYQIGVFISRSSINLIEINAIWLLAVFQGLNVVLFMFEALYTFLPNLYIVLAAVCWEGLLGGAAYVNTFHKINTQVVPEKREFSMAITSLADALGITLAGFVAMPVHNYICSLPKNL